MKITVKDYYNIDKFFQKKISELRSAQWALFDKESQKCFKPFFDMKKENGLEDKIDMFDIRNDSLLEEKIISSVNAVKEGIKNSEFFSEYFDITYENNNGFAIVDFICKRGKFAKEVDRLIENADFVMELQN